MQKKLRQRINWTNTIFLLLTPIVGIGGLIFILTTGVLHWQTVLLSLFWLIASGLSITAGYHRLFAHRTYRANVLVRLFFILMGAAAFEGSVLEWSTDHRNHHRYTDTDRDPYDIKKGFWYAHIGWLFVLETELRDYSNVEDLSADPLIRFQHKYFSYIAIVVGFVFPTLLALLWGDPLGGLLIAGVFRTVLNQHFTFCINSVCHIFGKRTYSAEQSARDNWMTAFFTYGEGFHNFHHQFPIDYRNGIRAYHYDPSKWLIWGLSRVGLASDLKQVPLSRLMRYRLRKDEQTLSAVWVYVSEHLTPVRDQILRLLAQIEKIETSGKMKEYHAQLKAARMELKDSLLVWSRLTKRFARNDEFFRVTNQ